MGRWRSCGSAGHASGIPDRRSIHITDRGLIAAGKVAHITIFDPDTIAEKPREPVASLPAGGVQVRREAVGIDYGVVNRQGLLENGGATRPLARPARPGSLLSSCRARRPPPWWSCAGPPPP